MPVLVALITVGSTSLGGAFAFRHRDRLHLILGFSAGVLLGVVAFDLLPEVFELVDRSHTDPLVPMVALVVAFLAFHALEKTLVLHAAHEDEYGSGHHHGGGHHTELGVAAAAALCLHSLADGLAIGLAFQAGTEVGVAVTVAVVAHDFADGLNTVTLMLRHGNSRGRTLLMLALDAIAPIVGAGLTMLVTVPDATLVVALGAFSGILLYLCTADILPEAHANHPSGATLACTVAGAVAMFAILGVTT